MRAISKFHALSWLEKRTVFLALIMLPVSALILRCFGLQRAHQWYFPGPGKTSKLGPGERVAQAKSIAHAVDIAAIHGFYQANCLKRSLVLGKLLHNRGIDSDLKIGTRLRNGELFAHAWIMCGDTVVNDRPDIVEDFCAFKGGFPTGKKLVFESSDRN